MLTPSFKIDQNDEFLVISIEAKYSRVSDAEVYFTENDFKFHSKPYFLRLILPGKVKSSDDCNYAQIATYNSDSGIYTIRVAKKNPGEFFEGLDLITSLIAVPKPTNSAGPNIEVLDGECDLTPEDDDFEWHIEQTVSTEPDILNLERQYGYGFANKKSGCFARLQEEFPGVVDVRDPDTKPLIQRREERVERENCDFSDDHYLADLFELGEQLDEIVSYEAPWDNLKGDTPEFTSEERLVLKDLPRREYLLSSTEVYSAAFGLVDIIFSYAYDRRTNLGESNIESGWTISKLSPTLSWFDSHSCLKEAVIAVVRRSLCYPLYRNWKLTQRVLEDLKNIFQLGRRQLVKCLLQIRQSLTDSDGRHVLNELYVIDYCVWIQRISKKLVKSLSESLSEISITKAEVGFDLKELEAAGYEVQMEEDVGAANKETDEGLGQLCEDMSRVQVANDAGGEGGVGEETEEEASKIGEGDKNGEVEDDDDEDDSDDSDDSDSDQSVHYYLDSDDNSN